MEIGFRKIGFRGFKRFGGNVKSRTQLGSAGGWSFAMLRKSVEVLPMLDRVVISDLRRRKPRLSVICEERGREVRP